MTFANDAKNGLPLTETTLAEQLKRSPAGYKTFAVSICHILSLSLSRSLARSSVGRQLSFIHADVRFAPIFLMTSPIVFALLFFRHLNLKVPLQLLRQV